MEESISHPVGEPRLLRGVRREERREDRPLSIPDRVRRCLAMKAAAPTPAAPWRSTFKGPIQQHSDNVEDWLSKCVNRGERIDG